MYVLWWQHHWFEPKHDWRGAIRRNRLILMRVDKFVFARLLLYNHRYFQRSKFNSWRLTGTRDLKKIQHEVWRALIDFITLNSLFLDELLWKLSTHFKKSMGNKRGNFSKMREGGKVRRNIKTRWAWRQNSTIRDAQD